MMKCFPCLSEHDDPYPTHAIEIDQLTFDSDLVLFRPREELLNRKDGEDVYLIGAPLTVSWSGSGAADKVTVPSGFITDLTSVPWILRWFVSRAGPWLEAAVIHDYLYIAWQVLEGRGAQKQDRKFADDIMFAAMTHARVGSIRKWAIYLGVRLGGGWTYEKTDTLNFADVEDPRLIYLAGLTSESTVV
jgi:hypothetical protein